MTKWCAVLTLSLLACGGDPVTTDDDGIDADVTTGLDGGTDGTSVDRCGEVAPACPTLPAGYARGDGLKQINECAFPLATDPAAWDSRSALIDTFPATLVRTPLDTVLADLNRTATKVTAVPGLTTGLKEAYTWQSGDQDVTYWIPQGITGSFDTADSGRVGGRRVLMVSWYYEQANDPGSTEDKGVRIALVDITNPAAVPYRFALLVEPIVKDGRPDFAPVHVHAGGLAWVGDHLYVPVTGSGFRVFDLTRILRVDSTEDRIGYAAAAGTYAAYGYQYVIPQVGEYTDAGTCASVFSWVAVDRTTHELVSGEYDATTIGGRVFRWPIGSLDRLALTPTGRVLPTAAYFSGETHVQGGLSQGVGRYWLSSSRPAAGHGELKRSQPDAVSRAYPWADSPEDLAYEPQTKSIWSLSEAAGSRVVFSATAASVGGL